MAVAGATPAVGLPVVRVPGAAAVGITGATPAVTATANVMVLPAAAALYLVGAVPLVDNGSVTEPPEVSRPGRRPPQRYIDVLADDEDVLLSLFAA
jgi:hypothetical protein